MTFPICTIFRLVSQTSLWSDPALADLLQNFGKVASVDGVMLHASFDQSQECAAVALYQLFPELEIAIARKDVNDALCGIHQ